MTYKNLMAIFPYKTESHISLLSPHCSRSSAHPCNYVWIIFNSDMRHMKRARFWAVLAILLNILNEPSCGSACVDPPVLQDSKYFTTFAACISSTSDEKSMSAVRSSHRSTTAWPSHTATATARPGSTCCLLWAICLNFRRLSSATCTWDASMHWFSVVNI